MRALAARSSRATSSAVHGPRSLAFRFASMAAIVDPGAPDAGQGGPKPGDTPAASVPVSASAHPACFGAPTRVDDPKYNPIGMRPL